MFTLPLGSLAAVASGVPAGRRRLHGTCNGRHAPRGRVRGPSRDVLSCMDTLRTRLLLTARAVVPMLLAILIAACNSGGGGGNGGY
jgi:hypothetical protein